MAMYYGPNFGDFSALITINNGRAHYSMADGKDSDFNCIFDFVFNHVALKVPQTSGDECGFGHNVSADGDYYKVE
jgi:hypothetical protein